MGGSVGKIVKTATGGLVGSGGLINTGGGKSGGLGALLDPAEILSGGSRSSDNSATKAYEVQLATQRAETEKTEAAAARLKALQDDAYKRQVAGRASTLLTGYTGDEDASKVKLKTLLGQ